jgi:hypothetical protein
MHFSSQIPMCHAIFKNNPCINKHIAQNKDTQPQKKKKSTKERISEIIQNPVIVASVLYPLGILLTLGGLYLLFNWLRASSKLENSESDIRLSSPYGAGVSRYVRYLEGTEASKEKRLF